jgi:hypothetical protein
MLHIKVPRCWKVRNDVCGGVGATFLNRGIRRPVILKPDVNELSTRVQLNRCLAQLRVHRSEQCALKRQKQLRRVRNGVHVLPNEEVERPPRSADQVPQVRTLFGRSTRASTNLSQNTPMIVATRLQPQGNEHRSANQCGSAGGAKQADE